MPSLLKSIKCVISFSEDITYLIYFDRKRLIHFHDKIQLKISGFCLFFFSVIDHFNH